MKILLDHNLDRRLKSRLTAYECQTTYEAGWSDASNGELLLLAEENGFDLLLTADSSIKNQQNIEGRKISILVLRAPDNRLVTHIEMIDAILVALESIRPGELTEVFHPKMS
ncbi:MAG TPA: DUF5615 family PIN-like protein [Pyrinomonadaceae bacterium]|nr:DUF5615 family PIN-like protein [Pyrinomonadaceae bacterium]HMP67038.1 DUF5615 family PIN-like protein [Pyrinomonadaceae bacterium]